MQLRHVAVLDDSVEFQYLVQAMFDYLGITKIELWSHSAEALPELIGVPPQLLVLDVMMSGIDGIAVWRKLRQEKRTRTMPIIICTAAINRILDQETFLQQDPYTVLLTKPFTLDELKTAMQKLIPQWQPNEK